MERRYYERITARLGVEFDCNNTICCSSAINLSEKGMLLRTKEIYFPMETSFEIFVHLKAKVLIIPVKVIRLAKTENSYDIMGVKLIKPPQQYFDYVDKQRSSVK